MNARARRLAPFAGYLMVGLVVVVLVLPNSPDSKASGAKVIAFFTHHKNQTHLQDFLLAYAALTGVVYFTALAAYLRDHGSRLLATTTVGGAILMAAGFGVGAGLNEALVDQPSRMNASVAQTLNLLGNNGFGVLLFAGLALATTSAGVAMLRTKSLPTALGVVTTIVGLAFTSGFLGWPAFLASGPLTLVIAAYVYTRTGEPSEITLPETANAAIPAQARRTAAETKTTTNA